MPTTKSKDKEIFEYILELEQEPEEVKPKNYYSAFMVNVILKAIPIGLVFFDRIFIGFFNERFVTELIILFIVIEFWFTKNVTGKRMLGVYWFFGEDEYGVERLMFECRANDEYTNPANSKLFWFSQIAYLILPTLFVIGLILLIPNTVRIDVRKILLNVVILISGIANMFYFFKVTDGAQQRQMVLRTRVGIDYLRKLGLGSIHSHY